MKPKKIQRNGNSGLNVAWSDGHISDYTMATLRDNCPCAVCKAERSNSTGLSLPIYSEDKYILTGVKQVGTYAIQISWKDGHNTGIYTFEYLRLLCRCEECTAE